MADDAPAIPNVLAEVGPRLRRIRTRKGVTLTELAAKTGISKSTLSRLESGQRKPSLELLLPLAEAHQVPLDELVGAPEVGDPRIRMKARKRNGRIVFPLTQQSSGMQVWKVVIPPERNPELRVHKGYEWLYVLSGRMRLILGEQDVKLADALRLGGPDGMQDYTASLKTLVDNDLIDRQVAIEAAPKPEELRSALRGIEISSGGILQI